jgi:hypothetical protein
VRAQQLSGYRGLGNDCAGIIQDTTSKLAGHTRTLRTGMEGKKHKQRYSQRGCAGTEMNVFQESVLSWHHI